MYAIADHYRALENSRPADALLGHSLLLIALTVLTLIAGIATSSLAVLAVAGLLAIVTVTRMQTSAIERSDLDADTRER